MAAIAVSPITVEVVRNAVNAYADEMATALCKSAYNMMIYEVRDFCCGLIDAEVGQEDRQPALVLRDHARLCIDQPAAEVTHLVDHQGVGRLAQRRRHLVGIGIDGVAYDLDGDGTGFHRPRFLAIHLLTQQPASG